MITRATKAPRFASASAALCVSAATLGVACSARAEGPHADGFAVERFVPSPAAAGFLAADALDASPRLGGAMQLTTSFAKDVLRIPTTDGSRSLPLVSSRVFANVGFAMHWNRFRVSADFQAPLLTKGTSGTVGGVSYGAPDVDVSSHPDTFGDARIGFDARVLGTQRSAFRLGMSTQLYVPSGNRDEYDTDDSYRAHERVLFAGDFGRFRYAGSLGAHLRLRDERSFVGAPRGPEGLFAFAALVRFAPSKRLGLQLGPEVFGATALRHALGRTTTAVEGLLTGRATFEQEPHVRVEAALGLGGGLHTEFGAPELRGVLSIALSSRPQQE